MEIHSFEEKLEHDRRWQMYSVFIGIQIIVILLIFFAQGLLLRGDGSREQKMMNLFLMVAVILNVGYLLELTAQNQ